jgi:hypothetical protein
MKFLLLVCLVISVHSAICQQNSFGDFTNSADIGKPKNAGSSSYDPETKTYTITGSGYNIWFNRDEFQYLYNKMSGDFTLTADFEFLGDTGNAHRKIGWMVRESEDESAVSMNAVQHGDGLVVMQWRGKQGENMRDPEDEIFFPTKKIFRTMQLERKGNNFTMRIGDAGKPLQLVGSHELAMPGNVLAGVYICSHDENRSESAKISNVKIIRKKK